jgi:hypothetical protein
LFYATFFLRWLCLSSFVLRAHGVMMPCASSSVCRTLGLICHSQPFRMFGSQCGANAEPICLRAIFARRVTAA